MMCRNCGIYFLLSDGVFKEIEIEIDPDIKVKKEADGETFTFPENFSVKSTDKTMIIQCPICKHEVM
jgi:hypothetical protein